MLELNEKKVNNCTIISVSGEVISQSDINRLEKRIFAVYRNQPQIILDLSGLNLIGTQGIRMLAGAWHEIYSEKGRLILACLQAAARIPFAVNKAFIFIETATVTEALEKIKC